MFYASLLFFSFENFLIFHCLQEIIIFIFTLHRVAAKVSEVILTSLLPRSNFLMFSVFVVAQKKAQEKKEQL